MSLPLAGLTLLMLLSLEPTPDHRTLVVLLTLALFWSIYLFVVNERPNVTVPLTLVILIQGSVALGQFVCQRDLGIRLLGEFPLDPQISGISVLWARDSRWLRAYGLTGHPTLLGATLAVLLLLLADDIAEARGWRQLWFTLVASVGLLGLLTTFSRSAWLAFGLGLLAWTVKHTALERRRAGSEEQQLLLRQTQLLVPVILAALFLVLHPDLVASRFLHLETPLEARSLRDRQLDADLAIRLIRQHPWRGVGVRNYLVAVRAFEPDSRTVHNVPLLTAAELGLPGAALWSWLALTGLLHPLSAAWLPWCAMLVTNFFDIGLSMTNSWYATVVFALLAAHVSLPSPRRSGATSRGSRRTRIHGSA
jgi:O-antigen ligase